MKNPGKLFILLIITIVSVNYAAGQENYVRNLTKYLYLDGKQLVIKYDLPFADTAQLFDITLKINYNKKIIQPPDSLLKGSWGNRVKPGIGKVIFWTFPGEFREGISKVAVDVIATKTIDPIANFSFEILGKNVPFEVRFNNVSKNVDLYSWSFGDRRSYSNNISAEENPVHIFKSDGVFNVQLSASNSKSQQNDYVMKVVTLSSADGRDVQKHKKMKKIWLGSAIGSGCIGGYAIIASKGALGPVALVVSGVCVSQVVGQSKKIKEAEQAMSAYFIPVDKGGVVGIALNF